MKLYRFVAMTALPLMLCCSGLLATAQDTATKQTDRQLKQQEKADKAQAKADKDTRKALKSHKVKKADKSQAKADAEAAKASTVPQTPQ